MSRAIRLFAIGAAALLAACSNNSGAQRPQAAATQPALTNPTGFPLAAGARVLDVKPFSQTISSSTADRASGLAAGGAGTYAGHEVLAGSGDSAASLRTWLHDSEVHPPAGFASMKSSGNYDKYGVNYAVFKDTAAGSNRSLVVVVVDPAQVRDKLGAGIDLVDKYRSLPDFLRQPIDDQLKSRFGISGTEATDPSSPLGMTLSALKTIQSSDERAIVMVDAAKR